MCTHIQIIARNSKPRAQDIHNKCRILQKGVITMERSFIFEMILLKSTVDGHEENFNIQRNFRNSKPLTHFLNQNRST